MSKRAYRRIQGLLLLASLAVLSSAFYVQYVGGLQPCPLCIVQRICAFLFAMLCIMGLCLSTRSRAKGVAVFQMLFAAGGLFFSGRQLWLQSLPADQVPACLPGFDVLVRYFPWHDVMFALFWGTGECSEVSWRLLGFSMPAWAALYFGVMLLASLFIFSFLSKNERF